MTAQRANGHECGLGTGQRGYITLPEDDKISAYQSILHPLRNRLFITVLAHPWVLKTPEFGSVSAFDVQNDFTHSGVIAVTGTSSGLGKCFVEAVLASGERVVATLRKPQVLAYLKDKYTPEQLLIQQLDVVNDEHIEAAFAATKEHFGRLDVVINNAGYGLFGEAESLPLNEAREQLEVLFWGPVKISLKVRLPHVAALTSN